MKALFSKNNIIYMLLIGIGFFWCGSVYLTQEYYLAQYLSASLVNTAVIGIGSISMAMGIFLFSYIYKKNIDIKRIYIIFLIVGIVLSILFFFCNNNIIMMVIINIICLIGPSGFGAGYHFALLSTKIEKKFCGRVFAISYAFGSLGTWVLTKIPKINVFTTSNCLMVYIPFILLNIFLIYKYGNIKKELKKSDNEQKNIKIKENKIENTTLIVLYSMITIMAIMSSYGTSMLANIMAGKVVEITLARAYYAVGLIVAGIIVDKTKRVLEIITIVSLVFPLCACIFLKENIDPKLMYSIYYLLTGFFTLFRTIIFVNLAKSNYDYIGKVAYGLAITRIIEGLSIFMIKYLINNYMLSIMVILFTFIMLILYYFLYYDKKINIIKYEALSVAKSSEEILKEFCVKYNLTKREEEIITKLVNNYSNQEIADQLYISLGTAKNTISRIYKKTNMNKNEIKRIIFN